MSLRDDLNAKIKEAMLAKDKARTGALRLLLSEVKKVEVDQRITLGDNEIISIASKMVKQHEDSASQYIAAGRTELAEGENFEASVIKEFLPQPLTDDEIKDLISKAITEVNAQTMSDMAKVMQYLKPLVVGRTDMGALSKLIKDALTK